MQAGLSFEQAPPISVPYRFFLTAPLFGMAAGLLLLWQGPELFASRWTSGALALTHLLVVGFMLQAMCGAMLQILPVAAGCNIWKPVPIAWVAHPGLTIGGILLIAAFLSHEAWLFQWAVIFLTLSLAIFAAVVLYAVLRTPAIGPTIMALRVAVLSLVVTVTLGATLASAFGWQLSLPMIEITHVHAAWGLGGWSLLLVAGVGYFVVPMFQLTPSYPAWFSRYYSWILFILLTVWSLTWLDSPREPILQIGLACLTALLPLTFAIVTLRLQGQRRRKMVEPTLLFWRVGASCLILTVVVLMLQQLVPVVDEYLGTALLIGALVIVGTFMSLISGMLYKIMPFLNWLHLQKLGKPGTVVPNIREMIPEKRMFWQFRLHLATIVLLVAAVPVPLLAHVAGLTLLGSCLVLEWNLLTGTRNFRRFGEVLRERIEEEQRAESAAS